LRVNSTTVPFYLKNAKGNNNSDEDVESFQRRLDTLIVNFRGETMAEFMRTKKQLNNDSAQTLDAERRRFNTLLGVKQNEIEQLKESLANKTKGYDELNTRCEVMALWAGKAKTLLRIKFI
jgi:septal ring factor EnvC (AmiA/AmiB activator)